MSQLDAKSVVVGINGSKAAGNAGKWAIDEAPGRQMPLRLVYVTPRQGEKAGSPPSSEWELERAETALSQEECDIQSAGSPVEVETAVLSGDPAQVLVNE